MINGISYIKDQQGNPIQAVLDLRLHKAAFIKLLNDISPAEATAFTNVTTPNVQVANTVISTAADKIIEAARSYYGTPHVIGGLDTKGIDCSGLTMMAFQAANIALPRVSRLQADLGTPVEKSALRKGDLVFFATGTPGRISHVGVVSDVTPTATKFVHASSSKGVIESNLAEDYWAKAYLSAKRVLS